DTSPIDSRPPPDLAELALPAQASAPHKLPQSRRQQARMATRLPRAAVINLTFGGGAFYLWACVRHRSCSRNLRACFRTILGSIWGRRIPLFMYVTRELCCVTLRW